MKRLLLVLIGFVTVTAYSQIYTYGYDAAGNRISRAISLKSAEAGTTGVEINTGEETAQPQKNIYHEELGEITLSLYPNPTKGEILVELTNLEENPEGAIRVYDIKGNRIFNQETIGTKNTVDLREQPQGNYILNVYIDGKTTQWKIIKE